MDDEKITTTNASVCTQLETTPTKIKSMTSLLSPTVMGKDRAKKVLKALGSQNKYVKEQQQQQQQHQSINSKESIKKKEKKIIITPNKKAQDTIDEIEELKRSTEKNVTFTYFNEHMIHHIVPDTGDKNTLSTNTETAFADFKVHCTDRKRGQKCSTPMRTLQEEMFTKPSLDAIKAYANTENEKTEDEEFNSLQKLIKNKTNLLEKADCHDVNTNDTKKIDKKLYTVVKDKDILKRKRETENGKSSKPTDSLRLNKKFKSKKEKRKRRKSSKNHDDKKKRSRRDSKRQSSHRDNTKSSKTKQVTTKYLE